MATAPTTTRSIIADAIMGKDDETTEETAAEGTAGAEAPAAVTEESDTTDIVDGKSPEGETATGEEPPEDYFGVSMKGLDAEARAEIIAGYQERDKFIQQLLRDKSDATSSGEAAAEATPEVPAETDMSDEAIAEALGLDLESDPFAEHTAKVAVPLARLILEMRSDLDGMRETAEISSTKNYWETSLTALEGQYGKLPAGVSQEDVMKTAADNGIAEPMDAYWRIMGPARQAVMTEVQKRRAALEESLKKGAKGTIRPSSSSETSDAPIVATDSRDAVKQAFAQLMKEKGLDLPEYGDDE